MRSIVASAVLTLLAAATPTQAQAQRVFASSAGNLAVETVAVGVVHPWALAFLPDGRFLVTERPGRLRIATREGKLSGPLAGLPKVFARGQGGLHDVALDRSFAQNRTIYFCFAEPTRGGGRTALARAQFAETGTPRLSSAKVIFRQDGPLSAGNHFGCRIAQAPDGNLFLTMGDHGLFPKEAQNLGNHLGKVIRIRPDGSVPPDNPLVGKAGAKPEIWSYGHRNSQGAAIHPQSGNCGRTSTGRAGATRSIFRWRAVITAGR